MADLQNATIEIVEEVKTTKGKYGLTKKIKGKNIETGQTNTYTLYDKKADGTTSKAWTDYPGIGATASIAFATKEGNLEDGTPYTQRIIRNFDLDIGNGVKNRVAHTPALAQNSRPGANSSSTEHFKQGMDDFSRRLGVQGHVNALLSNPEIVSQRTWSLEDLVRTAIHVEDEINKQLNPSKLRQAVKRHAPQVTHGAVLPPPPLEYEGAVPEDIGDAMAGPPPINGFNPMVNEEPPIEAYDEEVEGVPF